MLLFTYADTHMDARFHVLLQKKSITERLQVPLRSRYHFVVWIVIISLHRRELWL